MLPKWCRVLYVLFPSMPQTWPTNYIETYNIYIYKHTKHSPTHSNGSTQVAKNNLMANIGFRLIWIYVCVCVLKCIYTINEYVYVNNIFKTCMYVYIYMYIIYITCMNK